MELAQANQAPAAFFRGRSVLDWLAALLLAGGGLFAFAQYAPYMDGYEQAILLAAIPTFIALAWAWPGSYGSKWMS